MIMKKKIDLKKLELGSRVLLGEFVDDDGHREPEETAVVVSEYDEDSGTIVVRIDKTDFVRSASSRSCGCSTTSSRSRNKSSS
jgi:hypothetical protein